MSFKLKNLSLIAFQVQKVGRHNDTTLIERTSNRIRIFTLENESNLKKKIFYVKNRSLRPKIDLRCQFQLFRSRGKFFRFNIFRCLDEKRAGGTPWSINVTKSLSQSLGIIRKRFLNGSCESCHSGL